MTDKWERLLDYLYDELPPAERRAFEAELARDAELRAELEELQAARRTLAGLPESAPEPAVVTLAPQRPTWRKLGRLAGIAAAVLLLLTLFNARLQVGEGGVVFSMGSPLPAKEASDEQVAALITLKQQLREQERQQQDQLHQLDSLWMERLQHRDEQLRQSWRRQLASLESRQQSKLDRFQHTFRQEELPQLAALLQNLQLQQQEEMRLMLVDLYAHWQQTRAADLQSIESEFSNLYQNVGVGD